MTAVQFTNTSLGDTFAINSPGVFALSLFADDLRAQFDLRLTDADADSVLASFSFSFDGTDADPVAPIVIDLDGDGVELLSIDAGVSYSYGGSLAYKTAWAAPDDGILAYVGGGDGRPVVVDFVSLDPSAATDLAALANLFDRGDAISVDSSSLDGVTERDVVPLASPVADGLINSDDQAYGSLGVWRDLDSDGELDDSEFSLLSDLGIVSLDLRSSPQSSFAVDGEHYISLVDDNGEPVLDVHGDQLYVDSVGHYVTFADIDVEVHGSTLITYADGRSAEALDVEFATLLDRALDDPASLDSEQVSSGSLDLPEIQLVAEDGGIDSVVNDFLVANELSSDDHAALQQELVTGSDDSDALGSLDSSDGLIDGSQADGTDGLEAAQQIAEQDTYPDSADLEPSVAYTDDGSTADAYDHALS